jgi:biopolymer transport protein TolQ
MKATAENNFSYYKHSNSGSKHPRNVKFTAVLPGLPAKRCIDNTMILNYKPYSIFNIFQRRVQVKEVLAITSADIGNRFHGNVFDMILASGPMVQFVLLILFLFSVISWAVIFMKYRTIKKSKRENDMFLDMYMESNRLSAIFPESKKFRHSTIAEVFRSGYIELGKTTKVKKDVSPDGENTGDLLYMEMKGLDNVERALNRACNSETTKLESALGFLATTGSACPFIGLFGTVWGVMNAFRGIGAKGAASLAVVAPGISEALIATAAGLAAAIPAVIFYNYYTNQIKTVIVETDNFASEFLNIIERYYVKNIQA